MKVWTKDIYSLESRLTPPKEGRRGELTAYIPDLPPVGDGRSLRLRPAVLVLPGGGYTHTSLREAEPVALRFAARGWAAFVLHYSCDLARFPVSLREAAAVMAFIRRSARELNIDPAMTAAVGMSAGGHLAGLLATLFDAPEVEDLGSPDEIRPDALGLAYPVTISHGRTHMGSFVSLTGGDGALAERLSLEKLVRRDMCPAFIWHAADDQVVPCRGSLMFALALEEAGVPFEMRIYGRGGHGLATADALAHDTRNMPEVSRDLPGWPGAMMDYFEERGLRVHDEEAGK